MATTKALDMIKALPTTAPYGIEERRKAQKVFEMVGTVLTDYRQDYDVRAIGRAFVALSNAWEKGRKTDDYKALRVLALQYAEVVEAGIPSLDPFSWDGFFSALITGFAEGAARDRR